MIGTTVCARHGGQAEHDVDLPGKHVCLRAEPRLVFVSFVVMRYALSCEL